MLKVKQINMLYLVDLSFAWIITCAVFVFVDNVASLDRCVSELAALPASAEWRLAGNRSNQREQ